MTFAQARELIQRLRDPTCFPHPVDHVELIETHISWILLTGDLAYKIKKPVTLDFVDFSTLARRAHFCQEEVRLNKRLAPQLYLDAVPITGTPGAPRIGGDGSPIEYAIRMRQFDQHRLLSEMLARSEVTAAHIDELAETVARFHEEIPAAPADSALGSPTSILSPALDNVDVLSDVLDGDLHERVAQLRAWTTREFERLRQTFRDRQLQGMIRECHGDMHLGNMFLGADHVTIFDGIEFNDELRWIDIMSDVAFVMMDLQERGRADLSGRFLNKWLEHTGDHAGLSVLPFYLTYRALVRAKVDEIRLHQESLDPRQKDRLAQEAEGYLQLAEFYTRPRALRVVITHGLSGSGKTFGSDALIERAGFVRLRSDVERKRLHGLQPADSSGGDIYSAEATRRTYSHLGTLTKQVLATGFPVVVDATFLSRAARDQFAALATTLGVPLHVLAFEADPDELRARIRARRRQGTDASEADTAVLEQQLRNADPLSPDEETRVIRVAPNDTAFDVLTRIGVVPD